MSLVPKISSSEFRDARLEQVDAQFSQTFEQQPDFYIRAPGRANIIGDHIDYSYFSVLPMAIENNILMAVRMTAEPEVTVANVDARFPATTFSIENNAPAIDPTKLEWANYFKSGFAVAAKHLESVGGASTATQSELSQQGTSKRQMRGMQVVVSGNVPAGGGLSSSAAFVVAATLATLHGNGLSEISKVLLTQLSITCEQLLGMNTGGMDQAASIFGELNHCLLISFRPELKAEPLAYPKLDQEFAFLVANSWVPAVKHETAPVCYNLRVVEVSVAAAILARLLNVQIPSDGNLKVGTLRGVMEAHLGPDVNVASLEKMTTVCEQLLSASDYTREEAAKALNVSDAEFERVYLREFPVRFEKLKLRNRAIHVYQESKRVLEFCSLMSSASSPTLADFGRLMNTSHDSARDLYENSHPDVDELCAIARRAGSVGSRVTGAGFGGCTIHLVPRSKVDAVKQAIREEYYAVKYPDAPEDALVETAPGRGACVLI